MEYLVSGIEECWGAGSLPATLHRVCETQLYKRALIKKRQKQKTGTPN